MKIILAYDGEVVLEAEMDARHISKLTQAGIAVHLPEYKPDGIWKSSPFSPEVDWMFDYSLNVWLFKTITGQISAVEEDQVPDSVVNGEVIIGFTIP